ncbi:MAG: hypothetical protein C0613_11015 [Desulfobulbaceae bacterium]|nr:MAG: hypothetical protein C0613_11015 [Desulfobulbaceae bacterium]
MISQCPHCQHPFSAGHQKKIEQAYAALPMGKSLKFNCPTCQMPVEVTASPQQSAPERKAVKGNMPQPPSLNWLKTGTIADKEVLDDFSLVMVLMPNDHPGRTTIATVFEGLGYKPIFPDSAEDGINRMRFTEFAAVVLHSRYEGMLADSAFHDHMCQLPMQKRRYIYYVLVGPEFHTLYNLEALHHSANLVVNDNELPDMPIILKKSFREYDELFGPLLAALRAEGKK